MEERDYIDITPTFLRELFKECNKEYFDNSLPEVIVKTSMGRKTLGACHVSLTDRRIPTITISRYYKATRDEIKETMLHEMIHLWEWVTYKSMSHGIYFRAKAKLIQIKSNNKYKISRTTNRLSYQVAERTAEYFKNKLYAVFVKKGNAPMAWIVACSSGMEDVYKTGFTSIWNLELVGFVRNRFEPDFDRLPTQRSSHKIRGRVMPWDNLNEKYPEFAGCISA